MKHSNIGALVKRASLDGARSFRYPKLKYEDFFSEAESDFEGMISWAQLFVFYRIGFTDGYETAKREAQQCR